MMHHKHGPSCWSNVLVISIAFIFGGTSYAKTHINETYYREFRMPGVTPKVHDAYICTPMTLNRTAHGNVKDEWIIRYDPLASANRAHHMLLYACSGLSHAAEGKDHWDCGHHGICENGRVIYAWAKNAPATKLPDDVGFEIGGDTGFSHLVLQIHYAKALPETIKDDSGLKMLISTKKQKYHAGIYLLLAFRANIPPNTAKIHTDMNCKVPNDLNLFAFRTHAHKLGVVIRGYRFNHKTEQLTEIAKGNPQWPQAFYPMDEVRKVKKDDILHARCTFNSTGRFRYTHIGSTADDEMCNLYLMYYTEKDPKTIPSTCWQEQYPIITQNLPLDSDKPLPKNPSLEMSTKGENKNKNKTVSYDKTFKSNQKPNSFFTPAKVDMALAHKWRQVRSYDQLYKWINGYYEGLPPQENKSQVYRKPFKMPGVTPKKADAYICVAMPLHEEEWVVRFDPLASANRAHHMLLHGCESVNPTFVKQEYWDCGHHGVCDGLQIMYAWAKNAPSTELPENVGFRMGGQSKIKYLVLQIHYATSLPDSVQDHSGLEMVVTKTPQKYMAGIYLMAAASVNIPPKTLKTHADLNCVVDQPDDINLFAYRVHAHKLGSVITGYQLRPSSQQIVEIAKGNPHWPQAFYPMDTIHTVKPTDILIARCTYNSINRTTYTQIGPTSSDEMCNLYLMYYTDAKTGSSSGICGVETFDLSDVLPSDSDVPLLPNPLLEEMTHGENDNKDKEISYNNLFQPNTPIEVTKKTHIKKRPQAFPSYQYPEYGNYDYSSSFSEPQYSQLDNRPRFKDNKFVMKPKSGIQFPDYSQTSQSIPSYEEKQHVQLQPIDKTSRMLKTQYHLVKDWGATGYALGQITAVAIDSRGDIVIFHRGEIVWDGGSFIGNKLRDTTRPIPQATLLHLQKDSGQVMHEWGANFFYMPHGLTIDHHDNIWVTDVGMHQVFKFQSGFEEGKPLMTLGKKFDPGSDDEHFCKPTSVAVMPNGEFFIADGYCNSRIIHYTSDGHIIKQFDTARTRAKFGQFQVPHALAFAEDKGELCVADRENGRVLCFYIGEFKLSREFKFPEWGTRLFSVVYSKAKGGKIFAVNGPEFLRTQSKVLVFQADFTSGKLEAAFSPYNQGLSNPHDIACSVDGSEIYIAEIGPNKIWKFNQGSSKNASMQSKPDMEVKTSQLQEGFSSRLNIFSGKFSSTGVSSLILALLAIPVIVLVTLGIIIRCRRRGARQRYMENNKLSSDINGKHKTGLTLGSLLNKRRGFERIPNSEIDCDDDLDSQDSDIEEFSATKV